MAKDLGGCPIGNGRHPGASGRACVEHHAAVPRFAIREQHGDGEPQIRVVDDFKASKANDLLVLVDTSVPESLDVAMAMVLAHGHHSQAPGMLAFFRRPCPR